MPSSSTGSGRDYAAPGRKFGKRFTEALRRRTYPNTGLHIKQLAGVVGYSIDTLLRWSRGEARVPGDAIDALVTFFEGAGDAAFLHELFGRESAALDAELDALKRRLADLENRHATISDRSGIADAAATATAGGAARHESRVVGAADPAADERVSR